MDTDELRSNVLSEAGARVNSDYALTLAVLYVGDRVGELTAEIRFCREAVSAGVRSIGAFVGTSARIVNAVATALDEVAPKDMDGRRAVRMAAE